MNFLASLTPLNLNEEKKKFFSNQAYNPQFVYAAPISEVKLQKYPQPTSELLVLAEKIVGEFQLATTESQLVQLYGRLFSREEVTEKAKLFLKMHQLHNSIEVIWSASFISRATMSQSALKLKSTAEFREKEVLGMLYHEVGTHALRSLNYRQQPWYRKKKKYGFSEYLETEEGLAILHSLLPLKRKSLYKSALRYVAAHKAKTLTFSELWIFLSPYIPNLEKRWTVVLRQKRGLTDTAQPGVFMKDAVYFSGAVKMSHFLKQNNYELEKLYLGKISANDIRLATRLSNGFKPVLPSFYILDKQQYAQQLQEIATTNNLE